MSRRKLLILAVLAALVVSTGAVALLGLYGSTGGLDPAQIALGRKLYAEHCASCHGAQLEGQPNWQTPKANGRLPAPPHDESGHTWHHSDDELFTITKKGPAAVVPGYRSDMPAFEGMLTDDEIRAVLAFIKSTWPPEARRYQEARSRTPR